MSASEREERNLRTPVAISLRCEVGREFWQLESVEFRKQVAIDAEEKHAVAVKEWEVAQTKPKTPQEFHQLVPSA